MRTCERCNDICITVKELDGHDDLYLMDCLRCGYLWWMPTEDMVPTLYPDRYVRA